MATGESAVPARRPTYEELLARLQETEETLDAIRQGQVDAVVVRGPAGQQVYTLENADRPYRTIIEQMHEAAFTVQQHGILLYCNQQFAMLLGQPREALIGQSIAEYFSHGVAPFAELLSQAGVAGTTSEFMILRDASDAVPVTISLVELDGDVGPSRIVCGVITDLTRTLQRSHELQAANLQLAAQIKERERAEAGLQLALDAAEMGFWELDLKTGYATTSRRHDDILGYPSRIVGWTLERFLCQVIAEERDAVAKLFASSQTSTSIEFSCCILRAGDNAKRWLHVRGLRYHAQGVDRISGVVIDVTKSRETEEQLRQAQKMEAVGQLTGGIAHDFNNLLAGISGSLEMIGARLKGGRPADVARYLELAQRSSERAASLTQRLLAFSRRQTLSPKAVDAGALVAGMEDLLRRSIGPMIELEVSRAPDLWQTLADPPQLESALLNLALNARDAMPDGGSIKIETTNRTLNAKQAEELQLPQGDFVCVRVVDTGVGMSEEIVSRVFDPFFTTKPLGQGTGLGLSMVYGFARQTGGQIQIESTVGRGTTMSLLLPRAESNSEQLAANAVEHAEIRGDGRVIMVVDDEPTIRLLVAEVLNDAGFATLEAFDGKSAMQILESKARVDLLITDVGLPGGMNGRQISDAARIRRPNLNVLFITGYAEHAVLEKDSRNSDIQVLVKPFTLEALKAKIAGMMAEASSRSSG